MIGLQPRPLASVDPALTWWQGASIYQIYPRSFSDSNGDGIGDLPGITAHLDYVASLNVEAIWLSPFFRSPMRDFGYDVADYRDVDPIFGTLQDFDRLLDRAHGLGMKVIIDQVYSHTSDEHAWFRQSRESRTGAKADWYVWADPKPDGSPPSNWQSVFGGPAWQWDGRREQYYLHNFLSSQPDLNVHNLEVQEALLDTMRFWLDRGVDGFRLDAVNFMMHEPSLRDNPPLLNPAKRTRPFDYQRHIYNQSHHDIPAFLSRIRAVADSYGDRFLVAEVGGELAEAEMKEFTAPPDRLHSAYGFNYLYAEHLDAELVRQSAARWAGEAPEGWPSWTFSNHDAPRAVSRWAKGRDRKAFADMLLLLLVALRGNVFVYQGEELGLPQAEVPFELLQDPEAIANWPQTLGRDGARTPMPWRAASPQSGFTTGAPWLPVGPVHAALAVDTQERDSESTLNVARRVLALRRDVVALRTGGIEIEPGDAELLVFHRTHGNGRLLCVFNLGSRPREWSLPEGVAILESVNLPGGEVHTLPPMAGLIGEYR